MKDAATTFALVVGIDDYDDLPPLTGASADAVAFVGWLRRLGVPDANVLLHAAPSRANARAVAALGLPVRGCAEADIFGSFHELSRGSGSRLFVLLCGHGFYEPTGGRMFLTREATPGAMRNLGLEWHARFLRGQRYRRQILFMDGCLNLPYEASDRAEIRPGEPSGVVVPASRPDVVQVLACGAALGERAYEHGGRGLFTAGLLGAIDLASPDGMCVDVDDLAGELRLDLRQAMDNVVGPAVIGRSAALGRPQTPTLQLLSDGPGTDPYSLVALAGTGTADVTVRVRPDRAASDVHRVTLWSDENAWRRIVQVGASGAPGLPHVSTVPVGLDVTVSCTVAPTAPWPDPAHRRFVASADQDVVFDLAAAGPGRGRGRGGAKRSRRRASGPPGTPPTTHGPAVLSFGITPDQALRLAGPLKDLPTVEIRDRTFSLAELAARPEVTVDPGPLVVRVVLPWGTWTAGVNAEAGGVVAVPLPWSVGRPPLRVRLARQDLDRAPRTVVLFSHGSGLLHDAADVDADADDDGAGEALLPDDEYPALLLSGRRAVDGGPPPWRALTRIRTAWGALLLPLNDRGPVVLLRGAVPRAEPYSALPSPAWDGLVASGRLEDVPAGLEDAKWDDILIGLAGAYACLARRDLDLTGRVLGNLRSLDPDLPDLPVLDAALDRAVGRRRPATARSLADASSAVPLFRWGAGLGALAADHYELGDAAARYRALERRLVPSSVWTLFRGRYPTPPEEH